MAALVLVPGAWRGSWWFESLARRLSIFGCFAGNTLERIEDSAPVPVLTYCDPGKSCSTDMRSPSNRMRREYRRK
jgi:hypothetical protein